MTNGLELLTVNEEKLEDNEVYHLYSNQKNEQFEEYSLETVEEIYIRKLALDAQEFKVKITDKWFSNLYNRTVTFFKQAWHKVVTLVGLISLSLGFLDFLLLLCYLKKCTRIRATRVDNFERQGVMFS